jgi:hypothetical protein
LEHLPRKGDRGAGQNGGLCELSTTIGKGLPVGWFAQQGVKLVNSGLCCLMAPKPSVLSVVPNCKYFILNIVVKKFKAFKLIIR